MVVERGRIEAGGGGGDGGDGDGSPCGGGGHRDRPRRHEDGAVGRVGQDRSKVVAAAVSRGRRRIPEQRQEAGGGSAGKCGGAGRWS